MNSIDLTSPQWYTSGVSKRAGGEKRVINLTLKIYPSLKDQLERIAEIEDRTLSQVAMFLIERGLAVYTRDGVLREPGGLALSHAASERIGSTFVHEPGAGYDVKKKLRKPKR